MKIINYFGIILFASLLSGCGLSDYSKKQAEQLGGSLKQTVAKVDLLEKQMNTELQSKDFSFLQAYAKKENWNQFFIDARDELKNTDYLYNTQVAAMLDNNDSDYQRKFDSLLIKVTVSLRKVNNLARQANDRKLFLVKAKKEAPSLYKKTTSNIKSLRDLIAQAHLYSEKTKVDYSTRRDDIQSRFASLRKFLDDAENKYVDATQEYNNISSAKVDYAKLADSMQFISESLSNAQKREKKLKSKLGEHYRSYIKILSDMKIEYFSVLMRSTWDESSDWDTEKTYKYSPKKITEETYEQLGRYGAVASACWGWFCSEPKISVPSKIWSEIKVNLKQSLPSSHSHGEYWIEDFYAVAYHKYTIIENDKKKETNWVKVSEDEYWKHEEHLGLTIVSKPYGFYEEEKTTSASPTGLGLIAQPKVVAGVSTGNNQYGEWKQKSDGTSFWEFYGQYRLMTDLIGGFGQSHYSYDDWDHYNRSDRKKSYYGRKDQYGTYGAATYGSKSRYAHSSHAKRNPSAVRQARSGSSQSYQKGKAASSSSRNGVSQSIRGRGPNGKGK